MFTRVGKGRFSSCVKRFWNERSFFHCSFFYYIKQIDSMLLWVCSVTDHRRRQNVVRTSPTHSAIASCTTFLFLPHLTSYMSIQHGIYLFSRPFCLPPLSSSQESHIANYDLVNILWASAIPRKREKTSKTSKYRLTDRKVGPGNSTQTAHCPALDVK